ncbi:hypothetical protein [Lactiplantibacillus pentosus]|uniref:hypothetical protein n=1 Tax=Lactiplantibacillus pentosus TaxID=1589 RepID=UPI00259BAA2B|nr:hypothetical protein [Lactiplantibacillus pentosus]WFC04254.1 hypothetical protein PGN10_04780 [Lactiplantibacillus pentosus]
MTQSNKKVLSKSEIISNLNNDGLYRDLDNDFSIEKTRYATITDGKKFYDKVTSLDSNMFTHCIDKIDVLKKANAFNFKQFNKSELKDFGIELEEEQ